MAMPVRQPAMVQAGDQIDIGPYALQFTGRTLVPRTRSENIELVARNVCRVVTEQRDRQAADHFSTTSRWSFDPTNSSACWDRPVPANRHLLSVLSGRTAA